MKSIKNNTNSPEKLIRKLSFAGRYPKPDLINAIWEQRPTTESLLLSLFREAYHDEWKSENDPRWYRFLHAGKFMIAWQNLDTLSIFANLYMDDLRQDWLEWYEDDLFHFGPAAIPYLQQVVTKDSEGEWHYGRGLSGSILTKIATYYPNTRAEITAFFRAQLPPIDTIPALTTVDEMWESWASDWLMKPVVSKYWLWMTLTCLTSGFLTGHII